MASSRSPDAVRPVGQVDRHIQLLVHGVGQAGKDSDRHFSCSQLVCPGLSPVPAMLWTWLEEEPGETRQPN